jgi:cytochrome c biogenesis protein CcdA
MSNMTENQRGQMERYDLGETRSRLFSATPREQRVWAGLSVVFVLILAALSYAAIQVFDGWASAIVLADLVIIFFGLAMWLNPNRKHV